jgi:hypothetical protein
MVLTGTRRACRAKVVPDACCVPPFCAETVRKAARAARPPVGRVAVRARIPGQARVRGEAIGAP